MQPDESKVTISDNERLIKEMLMDLVIRPRIKLIEWSLRTKQTPNMKIGYPGQHLASLITGIEGTRTGARGHDLVDGTEVKSCSRVDQLDKCRDCKGSVSRLEDKCAKCRSDNIERKNDSKWLFTIRSEAELEQLTNFYDRILLILSDHPNFDEGEYSELRFQAFEIWPKEPRFAEFKALMESYYRDIYLVQLAEREKNRSKGGSPAPKNFWPYSFQFYKCKPVKIFECRVHDSETNPTITVDFLLDPKADRSTQPVLDMPNTALGEAELDLFRDAPDEVLDKWMLNPSKKAEFRAIKGGTVNLTRRKAYFKNLPDYMITKFPLRETNKPVFHQKAYQRHPLT